ncbi:MAG: 3-phosphoserine/phosphohydroxythreonine transaminase [Chloroflexota bacterium]|nr:3-phosphoserine/phosphohydroxythreonine transaminase [Chloroflexota bacterium]
MTRVMNFNPGPAAIPLPALEQARDALLDFEGTGMSIMEHSHRGKEYEAVHDEAIGLLKELLQIPAGYQVLFTQGGASHQFAQVPLNYLRPGRQASYVVTGSWSEKALAEAQSVAGLCGAGVDVAASTAEGSPATYRRVPFGSEIRPKADACYVHLTSNETIHGLQFAGGDEGDFPDLGGVPLVADMSSDFLWRRFPVSRFALIYAGAQKNMGPAGVTVVVAREDFIEAGRADIPVIFQYRTFARNNSLYNTPPTFAVYLVRNVLRWIQSAGGLRQIEAWNREKAALVYGCIDGHAELYRCPVEPASRSIMNAVFRLPTAELEQQFLSQAGSRGMVGLKGHRSVGGIRVSMYNAVQLDWVRALVSFMEEFASTHQSF